MRSKRKQKQKSKHQPFPIKKELPDLFSHLEPELVENEEIDIEYFRDACPCCLDRKNEIRWNKLALEFENWINEK